MNEQDLESVRLEIGVCIRAQVWDRIRIQVGFQLMNRVMVEVNEQLVERVFHLFNGGEFIQMKRFLS